MSSPSRDLETTHTQKMDALWEIVSEMICQDSGNGAAIAEAVAFVEDKVLQTALNMERAADFDRAFEFIAVNKRNSNADAHPPRANTNSSPPPPTSVKSAAPLTSTKAKHSSGPSPHRGQSPLPRPPSSDAAAGRRATSQARDDCFTAAEVRRSIASSDYVRRRGKSTENSDGAHKLGLSTAVKLFGDRHRALGISEEMAKKSLRSFLNTDDNLRVKSQDGNRIIDRRGERVMDRLADMVHGNIPITVATLEQVLNQYKGEDGTPSECFLNFKAKIGQVKNFMDHSKKAQLDPVQKELLNITEAFIKRCDKLVELRSQTPFYNKDGSLDMRYTGSKFGKSTRSQSSSAATASARQALEMKKKAEEEAAKVLGSVDVERNLQAARSQAKSAYASSQRAKSVSKVDHCKTENRSPEGLNMNGSLDMRRSENRTAGLNKDGSADRRFTANPYIPTPAASSSSARSPSPHFSHVPSGLFRESTSRAEPKLDFRRSENREFLGGRNVNGSLDMRRSENRSSEGLNKNGSLDMRRSENRVKGFNKDGSPDRRFKGNK